MFNEANLECSTYVMLLYLALLTLKYFYFNMSKCSMSFLQDFFILVAVVLAAIIREREKKSG